MAAAAPRTLAVAAVPFIIGAAALTARSLHRPPALPVQGTVPAFLLIDHEGQAISAESLRGTVWVASFIFTRCAGQCPMMSRQMARLTQMFHASPDARWVSFTVDPEWDTPDVLARYAASQGGDARWRFVTGDRESLERLCREGFQLSLADGPGTAEEPITHSVRLALVDRAGWIRGYYDATDAGQMARLARDLRRLLAEHSR